HRGRRHPGALQLQPVSGQTARAAGRQAPGPARLRTGTCGARCQPDRRCHGRRAHSGLRDGIRRGSDPHWQRPAKGLGSGGSLVPSLHWKHVGLYIYTKAALARFADMPSGTLEVTEQLEQLRLLEAGVRIRVWETKQASLRVDTPADLERAEQILTGGKPAWRNLSL